MTRACLLLIAALAAPLGCSSPPPRKSDAIGPLAVTALADAAPPGDTVSVLELPPAISPVASSDARKQFNVLVLSGGGADGAFAAGFLYGWSEAGTRPAFDVVTGISTGALIGALAFLGPDRDADLRQFYTTVTDDDVFNRRSKLSALLSDALADPEPLAQKVERMVDQSFLKAVAAEHRKGRRLYVGTTHLDARRLVVWDMGAIATRGTPEDLELFRRVLLASTAAPGFFPPVPIRVEVDGREYEELHVDGGVTAPLFFRPPRVSWENAARLKDRPLAGSNLYILVSGKLYAEPERAERRLLPVVANALTALVSASLRAELNQLYTRAQTAGMNYRLAAIPTDVPASPDPMSFDPTWMGRLFDSGRVQALTKSPWRTTPPGAAIGEDVPDRTGPRLTTKSATRISDAPAPPR